MPTLSKDAEIELLKLALSRFSDPSGWLALFARIDEHLNCRSFVAEFEADGASTARFVGLEHAREISGILSSATSEWGPNALSALIHNGNPKHCYELAAGHVSDLGSGASRSGAPEASDSIPPARTQPSGLIGVVRRPARPDLLIGLLFHGGAGKRSLPPATLASFWRVRRIVELGLTALGDLETVREQTTAHRIISTHTAAPCVVINGAQTILAEVSPVLSELKSLGAAVPKDGKLIITNRLLDRAMQTVLAGGHPKPPEPPASAGRDRRVLKLHTETDELRRIAVQRLDPPGVSASPGMPASPWVMIQVLHPADIPAPVETILQEEFGLSPSESHLARTLTTTGSVQETTEQLNITRNTMKTHLRRIFDKTSTHTQLELIRLVHRLTGFI